MTTTTSDTDTPNHDRYAVLEFIERTEASMFRTHMDTGAHPNALIVWNALREFAGLPRLSRLDLVRRYADTLEQDRQRYLAEGSLDAAERALQSWIELNEILADPNPHDALRAWDERLAAAAGRSRR